MSQKSVPERESVPREYLDTLTSADVPLHLHTSARLYRTCTPTLSLLHIRPLLLSFYTSCLLNFQLHPEVMGLGQVELNYRLTRNCWQITCLARSRGSFTVFCGAIEEFEPEAASSDDVLVVVGALLEVSAAREYFHKAIKSLEHICFSQHRGDCAKNAWWRRRRMDGG